MTEAPPPQWSDEVVAESFRSEIRARFEAHNAAFRARESADLDAVLRDHPEKRGQPGYEVHDSGAWRVYQASEIRIDRNTVMIVLPRGCHVGIDLIHMFDHTTAAWTRPSVVALIVDGEARLAIDITLVATWDDSLDAAWRKEGNDKRQVLVELFEEDVYTLDMLAARVVPYGGNDALRDRLKLALGLKVFPLAAHGRYSSLMVVSSMPVDTNE